MKKATLMKSAHKIAKEIVDEYGDYQIALSFALKEVWRQVKTYDKKRFGDVAIMSAAFKLMTPKQNKNRNYFGVPDWILSENLSNEEYSAMQYATSMSVERETLKAELVSFDTDFGNITTWVPKSVLVAA